MIGNISALDLEKLKHLNILIADDSPLNITILSHVLNRLEVKFDTAENGEVAYQLFLENNYSMVITDIEMPYMTGIELLQAIRENSDILKCKTPVLALTAHRQSDVIKEYLDAGMNEVISKPFKKEGIYKLLEKYC